MGKGNGIGKGRGLGGGEGWKKECLAFGERSAVQLCRQMCLQMRSQLCSHLFLPPVGLHFPPAPAAHTGSGVAGCNRSGLFLSPRTRFPGSPLSPHRKWRAACTGSGVFLSPRTRFPSSPRGTRGPRWRRGAAPGRGSFLLRGSCNSCGPRCDSSTATSTASGAGRDSGRESGRQRGSTGRERGGAAWKAEGPVEPGRAVLWG